MKHILEKAMDYADAAEVFRVEKEITPVCFRDGVPTSIEKVNFVGHALRIVKDGRIGFSSSTHPEDQRGLVERAAKSAAYGPEDKLEFPSHKEHYGKGAYYDDELAGLSLENMRERGKEMLKIVTDFDPEVCIIADITKSEELISIMNSSGGDVSYERTLYQAFLQILKIVGQVNMEVEHAYASTHLDQCHLKLADAAVWRFGHSRKTADIDTGKMPVLFTGLGFRGLYVPFFFGVNGLNRHMKTSPLTDKIGEKIGDERFTLIDDPTAAPLPTSCPVDDEGTPTKRKVLIENGVLKEFYYDVKTGLKVGVQSSGNGFKKGSIYEGFKLDAQPGPVPSNFIVSPGDAERDDMIADIKEGLIVDDTIGAGQGNNMAGDFSMNVAMGYKIENGKVVGRVRDVMVAGNVYEMINKIRSISRVTDSEDTLFGRYCVPWICFDDVSVSSN